MIYGSGSARRTAWLSLTYYNTNNESQTAQSVNYWKDVIVDVVSSRAVGADVEDLRESELLWPIHAEIATHEDDDAAWEGAVLNIWGQVGVFYVLEAEGLDFFGDVFESDVGGASVGHLAGILVEIDEALPVLAGELHDFEVLLEEEVGDLFWIHSGMYYL